MANVRRSALAGALAAALLVSLSGCIPVSDISAHVSDAGSLEFGICDAYEVDAIEISIVDRDTHEAETVWRVEGHIVLEGGSVVSIGRVLDGATEVVAPTEFDPSQNYIDFLLIWHRDGQIVSSLGHYDGADIVKDKWLTNSGGYRDNAC